MNKIIDGLSKIDKLGKNSDELSREAQRELKVLFKIANKKVDKIGKLYTNLEFGEHLEIRVKIRKLQLESKILQEAYYKEFEKIKKRLLNKLKVQYE